MSEQLSLFDSKSITDRVSFYGYYCNDDWSTRVHTVDGVPGIVDGIRFELTKLELKVICRGAVKVAAPMQYGYEVFFEDDGIKKEIFVRFTNFTTSKKRTVFEHIDLYFDEEIR